MKLLSILVLSIAFKLGIIGYAAPEAISSQEIGISIIGGIVGSKWSNGNVALIKQKNNNRVFAVKKGYKILKKYLVEQITDKYLILTKDGKEYLVYKNQFSKEFQRRNVMPRPIQPQIMRRPGYISDLDKNTEKKSTDLIAQK
jgi:hypothetical protein